MEGTALNGKQQERLTARQLGALVIACGTLGTAFVVFTAAAPPLPIFISP